MVQEVLQLVTSLHGECAGSLDFGLVLGGSALGGAADGVDSDVPQPIRKKRIHWRILERGATGIPERPALHAGIQLARRLDMQITHKMKTTSATLALVTVIGCLVSLAGCGKKSSDSTGAFDSIAREVTACKDLPCAIQVKHHLDHLVSNADGLSDEAAAAMQRALKRVDDRIEQFKTAEANDPVRKVTALAQRMCSCENNVCATAVAEEMLATMNGIVDADETVNADKIAEILTGYHACRVKLAAP